MKSPRRKAKAKAKVEESQRQDKGLKCNVCGGIGHPARMCPSEGWLDDLEQDMPEGEDTDEEGTTRQSNWGYLGSESCLMSSPPGLRDAFSEAGWTVVIRKSRNRQQCSKRCSDKRDTVLGSLWDDDNVILGQVADDRTRKGMVKISAGVDSGAEANALPENMMQWIPLKPGSASKSGKIFRDAEGDHNKTVQITNLCRERNVWRPADAMDVSSFQRLGRMRRHGCDDDGTGSRETTVGTS